jgi:predicted kinase
MVKRIVMLGAPGSGKGTWSKFLSDRLSLPHISTDDLKTPGRQGADGRLTARSRTPDENFNRSHPMFHRFAGRLFGRKLGSEGSSFTGPFHALGP